MWDKCSPLMSYVRELMLSSVPSISFDMLQFPICSDNHTIFCHRKPFNLTGLSEYFSSSVIYSIPQLVLFCYIHTCYYQFPFHLLCPTLTLRCAILVLPLYIDFTSFTHSYLFSLECLDPSRFFSDILYLTPYASLYNFSFIVLSPCLLQGFHFSCVFL